MMTALIKNTINLIWGNHRNERVTQVSNQLEQDKVVTQVVWETYLSLFFTFFDRTLFDLTF